ncbi:putative protein FAR1-RELATED SEQUENCE 10 isoform X2 [Medicago truncatula]|uniref:putative protein FAR1-RELATED SEQUENCE 10 isoform X2 n=1 Tax=Medicago truncatula TaxID=3880 RepID=UPI000D2F3CBE|nr:putative protein FAR1-RELATED SEQUENCE 10 isoform X2 [Medicago truncatula]
MTSKDIWIRKQQCPCGDWKCYITHEGDDSDEGSAAPESMKADKTPSDIITPYVGMVFKSDDEAFEHYGNFARKHGFSMRKARSRISPQLGVYKRDFVCYRSGFAPVKRKANGEHHRDRKSVRCGCDAKMYLSKDVVDGVSQWTVLQFSNVHNHELLEDDQVRLLPAYRKIHEADQERILLLSKAGFPVHRIVKMLELEKGIQGGHLSFLERDVRNFVQNRKKVIQENEALLNEKRENDVLELLEVCKATKEADDDFVYDFTMDENEKVENIAWSYGDSVNKNVVSGDVIYFDTSYRSITYGLLLGVWFGIDSCGRTIFFGCVLLQDETPQSFSWALQTFLQFMKGRCPQTILSDLDPGLRDAIKSEFSGTKHVVPMWNILNKVSSWFCLPLGPRYAEFKSTFNALFHIEKTEEFELKWSQMVSVFGLGSDKHIDLLYSVRPYWAPSYVRGFFLARMSTIAYSKSINAFMKEIVTEHTCLRSFFEQQELVLTMQYATSELYNGSYIIRHFKKLDGERHVLWLPEKEQILCSCKEFESSGILCRHALRILVTKNYFQLPEKYYLSRWHRERSLIVEDEHNNQSFIAEKWFQEYQSQAENLFSESSITKERSDYARKELMKELTRILNEVRDMSETDGVETDGICSMNVAVSPNS